MTPSKTTVWAFIVGFVLAALLSHASEVDAVDVVLMMGNYNGVAKTVQLTSTGAVIVIPQ